MKQLKATFNAVIVKPREEEETMYGGIIVPDLGKEKALIGTIVSVGPGQPSFSGEFIPTVLKVGQEVMLPPLGPNKIELEGQEYWVCPENQVLAIIEDTESNQIKLEITNEEYE
jgi:chaperonin GroES